MYRDVAIHRTDRKQNALGKVSPVLKQCDVIPMNDEVRLDAVADPPSEVGRVNQQSSSSEAAYDWKAAMKLLRASCQEETLRLNNISARGMARVALKKFHLMVV